MPDRRERDAAGVADVGERGDISRHVGDTMKAAVTPESSSSARCSDLAVTQCADGRTLGGLAAEAFGEHP